MYKTPDGGKSEVKLQIAKSTPQGPSHKQYATPLSPSITDEVSAEEDHALVVSTDYDELYAWLLQNKVDDQQIGNYLVLREITLTELSEFENDELQDLVKDIEKESKTKIQMIDKNRFIKACKKLRPQKSQNSNHIQPHHQQPQQPQQPYIKIHRGSHYQQQHGQYPPPGPPGPPQHGQHPHHRSSGYIPNPSLNTYEPTYNNTLVPQQSPHNAVRHMSFGNQQSAYYASPVQSPHIQTQQFAPSSQQYYSQQQSYIIQQQQQPQHVSNSDTNETHFNPQQLQLHSQSMVNLNHSNNKNVFNNNYARNSKNKFSINGKSKPNQSIPPLPDEYKSSSRPGINHVEKSEYTTNGLSELDELEEDKSAINHNHLNTKSHHSISGSNIEDSQAGSIYYSQSGDVSTGNIIHNNQPSVQSSTINTINTNPNPNPNPNHIHNTNATMIQHNIQIQSNHSNSNSNISNNNNINHELTDDKFEQKVNMVQQEKQYRMSNISVMSPSLITNQNQSVQSSSLHQSILNNNSQISNINQTQEVVIINNSNKEEETDHKHEEDDVGGRDNRSVSVMTDIPPIQHETIFLQLNRFSNKQDLKNELYSVITRLKKEIKGHQQRIDSFTRTLDKLKSKHAKQMDQWNKWYIVELKYLGNEYFNSLFKFLSTQIQIEQTYIECFNQKLINLTKAHQSVTNNINIWSMQKLQIFVKDTIVNVTKMKVSSNTISKKKALENVKQSIGSLQKEYESAKQLLATPRCDHTVRQQTIIYFFNSVISDYNEQNDNLVLTTTFFCEEHLQEKFNSFILDQRCQIYTMYLKNWLINIQKNQQKDKVTIKSIYQFIETLIVKFSKLYKLDQVTQSHYYYVERFAYICIISIPQIHQILNILLGTIKGKKEHAKLTNKHQYALFCKLLDAKYLSPNQ